MLIHIRKDGVDCLVGGKHRTGGSNTSYLRTICIGRRWNTDQIRFGYITAAENDQAEQSNT